MIRPTSRPGRALGLLACLLPLLLSCGGPPSAETGAAPALAVAHRPATLPRPAALASEAGGADTVAMAAAGDSLRVLSERWPTGAKELWLELETPAGIGWAPESALARPAGERGAIATH